MDISTKSLLFYLQTIINICSQSQLTNLRFSLPFSGGSQDGHMRLKYFMLSLSSLYACIIAKHQKILKKSQVVVMGKIIEKQIKVRNTQMRSVIYCRPWENHKPHIYNMFRSQKCLQGLH